MQIEQILLEKLIPYANNSRTHSDEQVAQIASSIREFGFNNPVLIDEQETIIAGHGRVLAARRLDLETIPCIRLSHLSENQRKAYIIADNKIALNSGWDEELLRLELEGLSDAEKFATGFSHDELDLLFKGWNPDFEKLDGIDEQEASLEGIIKIKCAALDKEDLFNYIVSAVADSGIEGVEVVKG